MDHEEIDLTLDEEPQERGSMYSMEGLPKPEAEALEADLLAVEAELQEVCAASKGAVHTSQLQLVELRELKHWTQLAVNHA